MVRIIDGRLSAPSTPTLSAAQRRAGTRKLARAARSNPLRTVRLSCHGPVRDAVAIVGDWIWCETCADLAPVVSVRE